MSLLHQSADRASSPAVPGLSISRRGLLLGAAATAALPLRATPTLAAPEHKLRPVVELFTSQGCSSCPVADALFESYAARTDILALSYSVDYWDYLGWRDTLASPRFAKRQRAYAKVRGDGNIYTPQAVVNGLTHVTGSDQAQIDAAISQTADKLRQTWVPVSLRVEPTALIVEAPSATRFDFEATVWLLVVAPRIEVAIKRGENAGRMLTYFNVVRDITPIGMWNGSASPIKIDRQSFVPATAGMLAVVLQKGHGGPILGCDLYRA